MLLRLLKRSPFGGERPCGESCPSVTFSMVSRSLSQLGEIFNWRVWGFTYQDTQRHPRILGEKEDFFLGRPEGKRMFFSEEDLKELPRLLGGKRRFFWGRLKGKAYWRKLMLTKLEPFDPAWEMLGSFHSFEMLWQRSLQIVWIKSNFWQNSAPRLAVANLHG